MRLEHIDDGGEKRVFVIETKKGKPVVDRLGFVKITKGKFHSMDKIQESVLEEQFGVCA